MTLSNDWSLAAECKGADTELFLRQEWKRKALAYCRQCIVVDECLAHAYAINDYDAILGGKTPKQRLREMGKRLLDAM